MFNNRSHLQAITSNASNNTDHHGHHLTPQEAALRGASLAFQNQQKHNVPPSTLNLPSTPRSNGALVAAASAFPGSRENSLRTTSSRSSSVNRENSGRRPGAGAGAGTTGRISKETMGGSVRSQQQQSRLGEGPEQRLAHFLSSPASANAGNPYPLPSGGAGKSAGVATDPRNTSFIAATLAASRSVSPSPARVNRRTPLWEPSDAVRRKRSPRRGSLGMNSANSSTTSLDPDLPDARPIPPMTSLISMFEDGRDDHDVDPVKSSPRIVRKPTMIRPPSLSDEDSGQVPVKIKNKPKPSTKPKPKTIPVVGAPPSPVVSRSSTEFLQKPKRPEQKPLLESPIPFEDSKIKVDAPAGERKTNIRKIPKAKSMTPLRGDVSRVDADSPSPEEKGTRMAQSQAPIPPLTRNSTRFVKPRSEPPPKSPELTKRMSRGSTMPKPLPLALAVSMDGQETSRTQSLAGSPARRPSISNSSSSDDTFVSASSVQSPRLASPPRGRIRSPRPASTCSMAPQPLRRPASAALIRRTATGSSSQLPLESLSHAIMAGSLASSRHTPVSSSDTRMPPPIPPTRRKRRNHRHKHNTDSGRTSPRRSGMLQTLRQPASKSDDEEVRRPHHGKKGIIKKHTHHEGSRRRWREEITEREKKRYEAVWASNRGLFLTPTSSPCPSPPDGSLRPHQHQHHEIVRDQHYEELSEHVANVAVRDIWARSRLPTDELAEVWDLVYRQARVRGALTKQEFVVGMWLIDQRLRGRKIPPRVSDSVWDSAKGVRVLSPAGKRKGKGK